MTESTPPVQPEGVDVITYDEERNELRLLPDNVPADVVDWSRNLGIDKGAARSIG